jgi:hypothetical protein
MQRRSILLLSVLAICYFWTFQTNAWTLPSTGQQVIPSKATAPIIEAGSICDHQRNNLNEYVLLFKKNNSMCTGQAVYVKESYIKYTFLLILLTSTVYVTYRNRNRIKKILSTQLF